MSDLEVPLDLDQTKRGLTGSSTGDGSCGRERSGKGKGGFRMEKRRGTCWMDKNPFENKIGFVQEADH